MEIKHKMPIISKQYFDGFREMENFLVRDFNQLLCISSKEKFTRTTLRKFKSICDEVQDSFEDVFLDYEPDIENHHLFLDGIHNFSHGIPLFCCTYTDGINLLFFEPLSHTYHWGTKDSFFANEIRVVKKSEPFMECSDLLPDSFKIMYYLKGFIPKPTIENPIFQNFLD